MGQENNSIRIARSSKKRPLAYTAVATKKRVPLGDITNSADAGPTRKTGLAGTQKPKPISKKAVKEKGRAGQEIVLGCDDLEKSEDASLVCQSLRPLEVLYQFLDVRSLFGCREMDGSCVYIR